MLGWLGGNHLSSGKKTKTQSVVGEELGGVICRDETVRSTVEGKEMSFFFFRSVINVRRMDSGL